MIKPYVSGDHGDLQKQVFETDSSGDSNANEHRLVSTSRLRPGWLDQADVTQGRAVLMRKRGVPVTPAPAPP